MSVLLWPSPGFAFSRGLDTYYKVRYHNEAYWEGVLTLFLIGSACIFAASVLLPRLWQQSSAASANPKPGGSPFRRQKQSLRDRLREENPFAWLARGDRAARAGWFRVLAVPGVLWLLCLAMTLSRNGENYFVFVIMLLLGMHFIVKAMIAIESGRRFHQDRQSGAMELLLATPLSEMDIIAGQRQGLGSQYDGALLAITLANIISIFDFFILTASHGAGNGEEGAMFLEVLVGGTVVLWTDAYALYWTGMWRGLNAKKYPRSTVATWGLVMAPPWLFAFFLVCTAPIWGNSLGEGGFMFLAFVWFGAGVVVDVACINWAQSNLNSSFRAVVSERYQG
jgi:hypothetical protein